MKRTRHYEEFTLVERPYLRDEWCDRVLGAPVRTEHQPNGRIRHWAFIQELGRYLRVVTEADGESVITAFPDRRFKEDQP